MATHYCIGNPCWICFPEYAPKSEEKNYPFWQEVISDHMLHENKISGLLHDMIIEIFDCGISEDAHWRALPKEISLEKIKAERAKISDNSLEAKLLDLIIKDFESHLERNPDEEI